MKKITIEQLTESFAKKASQYFDKAYSKEVNAWMDDIRTAENNASEYGEYMSMHVEVSEPNKTPIQIEFYEKEIYDEDGNFVDIEYYI